MLVPQTIKKVIIKIGFSPGNDDDNDDDDDDDDGDDDDDDMSMRVVVPEKEY